MTKFNSKSVYVWKGKKPDKTPKNVQISQVLEHRGFDFAENVELGWCLNSRQELANLSPGSAWGGGHGGEGGG